ncbi:sigma-70 family RNA polymerase sigma factor [Anaerovibrio sp. RM50]|uniref:sigma-70 family RNA polymerase sigma factor n=1 Tax=Anaerovibrio sp. RM50 TaxID=1200557 RepID=UPI0004857798|nr:sigma-70 family RNA polymerase sigma factor [Anaerovibrio sp. RM50]
MNDGMVAENINIFQEVCQAHPQLIAISNEELIGMLPEHPELLDFFLSKNEKMVRDIVNKFVRSRGLNVDEEFREELFQVSLIKLSHCYMKYNPALGYKFSTFIYNALFRNLINYCRCPKKNVTLDCVGDEKMDFMLPSTESLETTVSNNLHTEAIYQSLTVLSELEQVVMCLKLDLDLTALIIHGPLMPYLIEAQSLSKRKLNYIYTRSIKKLRTNPEAYTKLVDAYEYRVA